MGKSMDQRGLKFNNDVAKRLSELGWQAQHDVNITKILRKGFDRNYGDIDVLAWNTNNNRNLSSYIYEHSFYVYKCDSSIYNNNLNFAISGNRV